MLSSFTWKEFISVVLILLVIYYVTVFLLYYRAEFKAILSRRIKLSHPLFASANTMSPTSLNEAVSLPKQHLPDLGGYKKVHEVESSPDPNEELNRLLEQIQESVLKAADEKMVKQELLWMIRSLLQQFSHIRNTDNIIAVNDFVILLVENHCLINLSQEDVNPLWN